MGRQGTGEAALGVVIHDRRMSAGWTQRRLAEAAAVSLGVIRDLEQGVTSRPRRAALERLVTVLGISPEGIKALGGSGTVVEDRRRAQGLRFQVLGPLAASRNGAAVPLGGVRQRAILGLLVLHLGAAVRRAAIMDVLWEGEPPPTAVAMLHSYVSSIRAALDPGPPARRRGAIRNAGDGYRLYADHVTLDLNESEGFAGQARAALRAGYPETACGLFEQALDLWHGPPLADVSLLRGHPVVTRLEAQHAAVVVEYAEAGITQGWCERVLPYVHALVEQAPFNERAHACLMMALAGTGQQAAALEVYQRIRERLDNELGIRPGKSLTDAHMRVLRREIPVLAPAPAVPDHAAAGTGTGGGTTIAGARADEPIRAAQATGISGGGPFLLPPAVADFTGREHVIAQLRACLLPEADRPGVPMVVLSGPPGAGKSALMLHAAHLLRRSFPDGQLWAGLDGASERPRDPGDVLGEWLRALGVHGLAIPGSTPERAGLYRSRLADRRVLVAADDAGSAAQVLPLLPGTAGCAVLVTSRRQLADVAGARLVTLGPLSGAEATKLLGRIVGQDRVTSEAQVIDDLVAACGRLPLAVRIAGAKLAARPSVRIATLAGALATERRRLDVLRIGDLSVRASIASGYRALSEPARQAFRLLGLLGPCDVADWVFATLLDQPDATAVVEELADSSMVTVVGADATGQVRYRLQDLLRDYAAAEATGMPEAERNAALVRAHGGWLQLAGYAGGRMLPDPFFPIEKEAQVPGVIPGQLVRDLTADPLAWFHAERRNLLAAVGRACAYGDYRFAARLASYQAVYLHLQERHQDARQIWRAVADAAERAGDVSAVAGARLRIAAADVERGNSANAAEPLDACIAALGRYGDSRNLALALYWRSCCAWDLDMMGLARDLAERGVKLAQQTGDMHAEMMNLRAFGQALARLGDRAEGIAACERALGLACRLGSNHSSSARSTPSRIAAP